MYSEKRDPYRLLELGKMTASSQLDRRYGSALDNQTSEELRFKEQWFTRKSDLRNL